MLVKNLHLFHFMLLFAFQASQANHFNTFAFLNSNIYTIHFDDQTGLAIYDHFDHLIARGVHISSKGINAHIFGIGIPGFTPVALKLFDPTTLEGDDEVDEQIESFRLAKQIVGTLAIDYQVINTRLNLYSNLDENDNVINNVLGSSLREGGALGIITKTFNHRKSVLTELFQGDLSDFQLSAYQKVQRPIISRNLVSELNNIVTVMEQLDGRRDNQIEVRDTKLANFFISIDPSSLNARIVIGDPEMESVSWLPDRTDNVGTFLDDIQGSNYFDAVIENNRVQSIMPSINDFDILEIPILRTAHNRP